MTRRLPDRTARPVLLGLALTWLAVLVGRAGWGPLMVVIGLAALVARRFRPIPVFVAISLVAGALAGGWSIQRERAILTAPVPSGRIEIVAVAQSDSRVSDYGGTWFLARPYGLAGVDGFSPWRGPPILVNQRTRSTVEVGAHLLIEGWARPGGGQIGPITYAARLQATHVETIADGGLLFSAGNALRRRVLDRVVGHGPPGALLAGFLVGETSQLTDTDVEALRRAGISHFIAVSGANVAGFLLVWWILLGPLGVGPRRRGVWGLLAIAVFVVATRWQPSVIRASLMAGLVLTGRVVGIPIDAWSALGVAGSLALLISPELASNLGFQLSVLATAGIMLGFDPFPPSVPVIVRRPLAATLSAQAAVTPLLLAEFGSVPLASPLTNLLAAPLVASSTLLGGVGALSGVDLALDIGLRLSALVLDLARWASWLPQIGVMAFAGLTVLLVAFRWPRSRPIAVLAAAIALVITWVPSPAVARPAAVFLDVGQGDATLLLASGGANMLIDGGPDQVLLMEALRRYQIRQLDLVVVTHPHNDHLLGLVGLTERVSISRIWYGGDHHHNDNWDLIRGEAASRGVVVAQPSAGSRYQLGDLQIDVLGPRRRYDGPNDESIVLLVTVGQTTVFMTGDAEVAAQRDIPPPDVDVLKTPHQGANTSSLSWLAAVNPELAVISVGANDYGHPSPLVVSTLEQTGATVIRTDQHGDVIVPLGAETITWPATAASGPTP